MTLLRYSLMRTMLLFGCLLVLYLLGARGVLLVALTMFSSIALSYFLLKSMREQLARQVADRVGRRLPDPDGQPDSGVEPGRGNQPGRGSVFDQDADVEDREDDARRDP